MAQVKMRLREIRKERGISQQTLAELIGSEQAIVSRIERGVAPRVSLQFLSSLVTQLDLAPGDLFVVEHEQLELLPTEKD